MIDSNRRIVCDRRSARVWSARVGNGANADTGFTLVELLAVIGIIAVLAALLFPVLQSVKERGRQSACLSNLKQLGAGFDLYIDHYNGRFPWARVVNGGDGNPAGNWAGSYDVHQKCDPAKGQLYPFVKNGGVYLCPSSRNARVRRIWGEGALPYPLSYSMNNMLTATRFSAAHRTSKVGLLLHESPDTINDGDFYWLGWADDNQGQDEPAKIHNGGTCVLFCDLHAAWQSYDSVIKALQHYEWDPNKP